MYHISNKIQQKEKKKRLLLLSILISFLACSGAYSQRVPTRKVPVQIFERADSQSVTVYEDSDFGGRFKTLGIGKHRLSDFNDLASSIKISAGLAAVVCEHADDGGGFGFCVDFLEDQPDLSKYNFNDKVSYIEVFNAQRPGFIYVRNGFQNGRFVAGHWERAKASGNNPVNAGAVVAPVLPPHTPTVATTIQVNDAQTTITALGVQRFSDASSWDSADTFEMMGVIGSDFRGNEEIGSAAFQRASNNIAIPDNINVWYPQKQPGDHGSRVYFKRTLSGTIDAEDEPYIVNIDGTYQDYDFTVHVKPSLNYMYLIKDGHPPETAAIEAMKLLKEKKNPANRCTEPFRLVEAEIDTEQRAKAALNFLVRQRIGKQIAVYGPWIYDKAHCHQPEIHPAEQIWWSEDVGSNKKYNLNLFSDASKRFWWRRQMDDGTKLKPWGAPPITGTFAIAFEVKIADPSSPVGSASGQKFEVTNIQDFNVAVNPGSNKTYNLVYQNNTLVSFVPHNDAFKVSFEKVGLKPGTTDTVRGFLVIETAVGTVTQVATKVVDPKAGVIFNFSQGSDPNKVPQIFEEQIFKKVEGHYMFSILRTNMRTEPEVSR